MNANDFIEALQLEPHAEGGYYRSSFRAEQTAQTYFNKERPLYTSIYFLLRSQDVSHLHRLKSDELWNYHAGSALTVHIISPEGEYVTKKLGLNILAGEQPQVLVPRSCIFGSSVDADDSFSLVGCVVAPGFDYEDFELFTKAELHNSYPHLHDVIEKLAYD